MSQSIEIKKLIEFIENHKEFNIIKSNSCFYKSHLGAMLADIILQAGLNYKNVVLPRVLSIYTNYPDAYNLDGLTLTLNNVSVELFLNWKDEKKIGRFKNVLEYLKSNKIQTTQELASSLAFNNNKDRFLSINGIGYKTIDYFLKLMDVETIAVDRHIIKFLTQANIKYYNYQSAKAIVEYTADILNISRRDIDYSIWHYMSEKSNQMNLEFNY